MIRNMPNLCFLGIQYLSIGILLKFKTVHSLLSTVNKYKMAPIYSSSSTTTTPIITKNKVLTLLTFDLDDTLFPIEPVVQDANIAMIKALDNLGYKGVTHEGFSSSMKEIRKELQLADETITYSELRKRTILREIQKCDPSNNTENMDGTTNMEAEVSAEQSFKAWLDERTASAERNLFPDTIKMLETITKNYPDAIIGAITNGRGNPLHMKKLSKYFQFCISGEDDTVFPHRKPHRGIYDATLSHVNDLYSISLNEDSSSSSDCCWLHVGDDLVNDVAASAVCGAVPIWLDWEDENIVVRGTTQGKNWSSATVEEQTRRKLLAEEAKKNSMSASIKSLSDLPVIIEELLK